MSSDVSPQFKYMLFHISIHLHRSSLTSFVRSPEFLLACVVGVKSIGGADGRRETDPFPVFASLPLPHFRLQRRLEPE